MTTLEGFAKRMFEKYSNKKHGYTANWSRLSKERKIEWMKDVLYLSEFFVEELIEKFGKPPVFQDSKTSFEMGYNKALHTSHINVINFINDLEEDLEESLEEFRSVDVRKRPR